MVCGAAIVTGSPSRPGTTAAAAAVEQFAQFAVPFEGLLHRYVYLHTAQESLHLIRHLTTVEINFWGVILWPRRSDWPDQSSTSHDTTTAANIIIITSHGW